MFVLNECYREKTMLIKFNILVLAYIIIDIQDNSPWLDKNLGVYFLYKLSHFCHKNSHLVFRSLMSTNKISVHYVY